jgi:hypothetical protein
VRKGNAGGWVGHVVDGAPGVLEPAPTGGGDHHEKQTPSGERTRAGGNRPLGREERSHDRIRRDVVPVKEGGADVDAQREERHAR